NWTGIRGNNDVDVRARRPPCTGYRHLGREHSDRVGIRDREFRVVDRYWARGHADIGNPAATSSGMAAIDQSIRGSDDSFRRHMCGYISARAPRTPLVLLLAHPLSEYDGTLATMAQPTCLGRVRGVDVLHDFPRLLVHRPDSGPRHISR